MGLFPKFALSWSNGNAPRSDYIARASCEIVQECRLFAPDSGLVLAVWITQQKCNT